MPKEAVERLLRKFCKRVVEKKLRATRTLCKYFLNEYNRGDLLPNV
jgi:hypothetical protein